jgi:hydroxyacylglutathione hydrolase
MIFHRVRSDGLAHLSYLVGSEGDAVVIDPRRDCQVYVDAARRAGIRIRRIFETHRNEDYVVGSVELAHRTGATIHHGSGLPYGYGDAVHDGQEFPVGDLTLRALATPGHTDHCVSYVLLDRTVGETPLLVFTGDALFVGDVGRTDFGGPEHAARMAGNLYDSLVDVLLPLGDDVLLYPAHGAGSVCGAGISEREESTLGLERRLNPLLQLPRDAFVQFKVQERHEYAPYFQRMEALNLEGPPLLRGLPTPPPLPPAAFQRRMATGGVVVDTRMPLAFGGGHIAGSYSIWLDGLPSFAGWVLPYDQDLLLVLQDDRQLEQAVRYLIRIGYDRLAGYLCSGEEGCGVAEWYTQALPLDHLPLLTVQALHAARARGDALTVLDVRQRHEWEEGHIADAQHVYVGHLAQRLPDVPTATRLAVVCSAGFRASLAASVLRRAGYRDVANVLGGMQAWEAAGYPTA